MKLKLSLSQGSGFYAWFGILFLAGFTPLPYKVFTISSGLVGFNLGIFILVSLISRGLRFFIISYLTFKFGNLFNKFMETQGSKWFIVIGILRSYFSFNIYYIIYANFKKEFF